MDTSELIRESRRQAILDSMAPASPDETLARFRHYLETGTGSLNEWDERFLGFIREHATDTLLAGTAGGDIHFVFSPQARAGFWVVARSELRGKGFFSEFDIDRLVALAQEKHLLPA